MAKNSAKAKRSSEIPKTVLATAKFLQFISSDLAARFAAKIFTTPLRHQMPKREFEMNRKSRQEFISIGAIEKNIVVYHYGVGVRKILLVHGWSGRGTQLVKFAESFAAAGYSILSFDAPAHGKSPGKTSLMPEFIASILQLEQQFGPFEAAIGHSLGGMSLLNSVRRGLKLDRMVIIGSGDIVQDIIDEFIEQLKLKPEIGVLMRQRFEKASLEKMDNYSSFRAAQQIDIPVLVVHDNKDAEVPVKCAYHIAENLKNATLMITDGLGHRKILGSQDVIAKSFEFINGKS